MLTLVWVSFCPSHSSEIVNGKLIIWTKFTFTLIWVFKTKEEKKILHNIQKELMKTVEHVRQVR